VIGTAEPQPWKPTYTLTATAMDLDSCKVAGLGGVTATATDASRSGMIGIAAVNRLTQARQMSFQPFTMTSAVPQSWTPITLLAGRPGMVFDHIAPANPGSSYLQLFGGAPTCSGYGSRRDPGGGNNSTR
jgi:hypothetical protein